MLSANSKAVESLLKWCQKHTSGYAGVDIKNFTTSWRSGLGFCALVHNFSPDKIDFPSLKEENAHGNCDLAFRKAKELGIADLMDADDMMVEPYPEKLSVILYLSQFVQKFGAGDSSGALQPWRKLPGETSSPSSSPSPSGPPEPALKQCAACDTEGTTGFTTIMAGLYICGECMGFLDSFRETFKIVKEKAPAVPQLQVFRGRPSTEGAGGKRFFAYKELKGVGRRACLPPDADYQKLEEYLSPTEFRTVFNMSQEEYARLPTWKKTSLKRELQLF